MQQARPITAAYMRQEHVLERLRVAGHLRVFRVEQPVRPARAAVPDQPLRLLLRIAAAADSSCASNLISGGDGILFPPKLEPFINL